MSLMYQIGTKIVNIVKDFEIYMFVEWEEFDDDFYESVGYEFVNDFPKYLTEYINYEAEYNTDVSNETEEVIKTIINKYLKTKTKYVYNDLEYAYMKENNNLKRIVNYVRLYDNCIIEVNVLEDIVNVKADPDDKIFAICNEDTVIQRLNEYYTGGFLKDLIGDMIDLYDKIGEIYNENSCKAEYLYDDIYKLLKLNPNLRYWLNDDTEIELNMKE